jgi:hypothetical protein
LMNWKTMVAPIDAPPFNFSQNVSSSGPVMLQWYGTEGLCNQGLRLRMQSSGPDDAQTAGGIVRLRDRPRKTKAASIGTIWCR